MLFNSDNIIPTVFVTSSHQINIGSEKTMKFPHASSVFKENIFSEGEKMVQVVYLIGDLNGGTWKEHHVKLQTSQIPF